MDRKTAVVGGLVAASVLCGVAFCWIATETAVPTLAYGAGEDGMKVTGSGWFALLLSLFGTGGFSVATIVALFQKMAPTVIRSVIPNVTAPVVDSVIDTTKIALYLALSKHVNDPQEKSRLVTAARVACDRFRDDLFPLTSADPLSPGV